MRQKQRPANAEKISGPAALGVGDHLSRFTVNYRFINKKGEENFATGVLVNFEGRLLLATVAHARPRSLSDIFIIKKLTSSSITPLEPYDCVTRREADPARDVAFFELQPDASSVIGADAIGADKIFDAGTGREHKTFLVGFPSELAAPHVPFEAR